MFVDAAEGLTGRPGDLEVYAARPFQFGELRSAAARAVTRVVFDFFALSGDATGRFSVTAGDALRVAMQLVAIVRRIDGYGRAVG